MALVTQASYSPTLIQHCASKLGGLKETPNQEQAQTFLSSSHAKHMKASQVLGANELAQNFGQESTLRLASVSLRS